MLVAAIRRLIPVVLALLVVAPAASGCAGESAGSQQTDDVTSTPALKAAVPGFTVWVDEPLKRDQRYGGDVWVMRGRTSKNLANVFSFAGDDEFGEALVVSPRVFEFTVDENSVQALLTGMQLFVQIDVEGGTESYFAGLSFATHLDAEAGSAKFNVHAPITSVFVDGGIRFRGVTSVVNGVHDVAVAGPLGPADALEAISSRTYAFDFLAGNYIQSAHAASPVLRFTATAGGAAVERDATIAFDVASLGLIHGGSVYTAFPEPACRNAVESCLEALPQGEGDTGSCGSFKEVQTCLQTRGSPQRMANDLRNTLYTWYQVHGADVMTMGGNTLEQATALVDASKVVAVTDPAGDPEGHDLAKFRVLSHPDVVFPGSDRRWFAAYSRRDGALDHVYDFE